MKKFIVGVLVGASLMLGSTVFADQIKQYILTAANYPIFVNGTEFKDASAPILNYEGSTYVPLAKLGDLTGVNYKWNDASKRVEIVTAGSTGAAGVTVLVTDNGQLRDAAAVKAEEEAIRKANEGKTAVYKSEFVEDQGNMVFHAYDINEKFMGRFTDGDDVMQIEYTMGLERNGRSKTSAEAPPKFSDGWISEYLFQEIFKYKISYDSSNSSILIIQSAEDKELYRLTLPADWSTKTSGDATVNSVKIKKYDKVTYFNIADIQAAGVIK